MTLANRALIIGMGQYDHAGHLSCPNNDAKEIKRLLAHHEDGNTNFDCELITTETTRVERDPLWSTMMAHFAKPANINLFYYAGHGDRSAAQSYLMTQEYNNLNSGIPLTSLMSLVKSSPAKQKVVILDACFSGDAGRNPHRNKQAELPPNCAVLSSTAPTTFAYGRTGRGVFSYIITEGLKGAAADPSGWVSVASLYAHADRLLTGAKQRPHFRADLSSMIHLRKCNPELSDEQLIHLRTFFPTIKTLYTCPKDWQPYTQPENGNAELTALNALFRNGMIEPVDWSVSGEVVQMASLRLTERGKHYWRMAVRRVATKQ